MDYDVIMDLNEQVGNGIPIHDLSRNMSAGMPRGNIQQHIPRDMNPQQRRMMKQQMMQEPEPVIDLQPPPAMIQQHNLLNCRDVFEHIQNCPICEGYFKRDKFYMIIIGILILIILYLMNKK
jgi:hypothetical protein